MYAYVTVINKKEVMDFKENKEGCMGCLEGGKGMGKWHNYAIISKLKEKNLKSVCYDILKVNYLK